MSAIKRHLKEVEESVDRISGCSSEKAVLSEVIYAEKHLEAIKKLLNNTNYRGKIRCFIHKTDDEEYEEFGITSFDDCLISDVPDWQHNKRSLLMEIDNIGLDGFEDSIKDVLKEYPVDSYVEIVADAFIKYTFDSYYNEADAEMWLEDVKHRILNKHQILRFIEERI